MLQGDYEQETVYSDDPLGVALRWQSMGISRLHVVDLDGAASGQPENLDLVTDIARAALVPVQMGGGVRDIETLKKLLQGGVDRVVLGTAAAEDADFVKEACSKYAQSIVVSIDARDGKLATRGWRQDTDIKAIDFARSMKELGVKRFVYTDISRDGTLTEPNFSAIFEMITALDLPVIASGGVATLNHLKMLALLGAEGAIVGKALYTRDIRLKQALEAVRRYERGKD